MTSGHIWRWVSVFSEKISKDVINLGIRKKEEKKSTKKQAIKNRNKKSSHFHSSRFICACAIHNNNLKNIQKNRANEKTTKSKVKKMLLMILKGIMFKIRRRKSPFAWMHVKSEKKKASVLNIFQRA